VARNLSVASWRDAWRECAAGDAVPIDTHAANPLGLLFAHITRAIVAAIFEDPCGLGRHTAAAMPLLPAVSGHYVTAVVHLLRGLALALQARVTDGDERGRLLSRTRRCDRWLAARAADAPTQLPAPAATAGGRTGPGPLATSVPDALAFDAARYARPGSVSAAGTVR